jgi:hypothetical protein
MNDRRAQPSHRKALGRRSELAVDRHIPALGHITVGFERRADHDPLRRYRLSRAKQALDVSQCGALLLFRHQQYPLHRRSP